MAHGPLGAGGGRAEHGPCHRGAVGAWLLLLPCRLLRGWVRDAWMAFQRKGYLLIATLVAAYVGLYSVMEARHERQANRALFERSTFMTMVASGQRGTFIAAMKTFGPVQTMTVPQDPALLDPRTWWAQEQPNERRLYEWARAFFPLCTADVCGRPDQNPPWRIDLCGADLSRAFLTGADLHGAYLGEADLSSAHLEYADLRGAFLSRADLSGADLRGANLSQADPRGANLCQANLFSFAISKAIWNVGANLFRANLRGANLSEVHALTQAQLDHACVDDRTHLPAGLTRPAPCPSSRGHD
jgi:Pentapeptide repeats (8 copies)